GAPDEELVTVPRIACRSEPFAQWGSAEREHRLDRRFLLTSADHVRRRLAADGELERRRENRLSRAGLAGDDVEARLEAEVELVDQREVADLQLFEHRARSR